MKKTNFHFSKFAFIIILLLLFSCEPDTTTQEPPIEELEDGTAFIQEEQFYDEKGPIYISQPKDERTLYYIAGYENKEKQVGAIPTNSSGISWENNFEGIGTDILTIKSQDPKLNQSLLVCSSGSPVTSFKDWTIQVFSPTGELLSKKQLTPFRSNAQVKTIFQVNITPKRILEELAQRGLEITSYESDFEIFCVVGSYFTNFPFLYFFGVRYLPNVEIIDLPGFINADIYELRNNYYPNFTFYGASNFINLTESVNSSINCSAASNSNTDRIELFLAGLRDEFNQPKQPIISKLAIDVKTSFSTTECIVSNFKIEYKPKLEWSKLLPISNDAVYTYVNDIILVDTLSQPFEIFTLGAFTDWKKSWMSKLSYDGNIIWLKEFTGLGGTLDFSTSLIDHDKVYVGGETNVSFPDESLGYIGVIEKATGNLISQKYFGFPHERFVINGLVNQNDRLAAFGWHYNSNETISKFRAWSFKIKKSDL